MMQEDAIYRPVLTVCERLEREGCALLAIDGRCGSGKSLLAQRLSERFDCPVIHMDDFFLPEERRTEERLGTPGGNVDWERVLAEVLRPLRTGKPAVYRPYRCADGAYGEPVTVKPGPLTLVEGSYSFHPSLRPFYDDELFLTVSPEEQRRRILERAGAEALARFESRWIPLEERYFDAFRVAESCGLVLDTTSAAPLSHGTREEEPHEA